jgi:NAD(P)H dehydrogenase (quinone)
MIAVTGATGKLGGLVVEQLLTRVPAADVVALVRDPKKAQGLAARGVHVRQADYERPETLGPALAGVDKLLLISSNEVGKRAKQHAAVIDAAKRAKLELLAYTSILRADSSGLLLANEHRATEQLIRESGVPFVFLRNGWYLENYTEQLAGALASGAILGSAKEGRIAAAARADFAAAAAVALTAPGQAGQIYELAGDAPFTLSQLAAEVARAAGKPIVYQDLPASAFREALIGFGVPAPFADVLVDADLGITRGELDDGSHTLRKLIGRPTTPLSAAVAVALPQG